jgi:hypothetical protein
MRKKHFRIEYSLASPDIAPKSRRLTVGTLKGYPNGWPRVSTLDC